MFDIPTPAGRRRRRADGRESSGERTEVKDGRDRYATIQINDLLQSMEGYRGLAILATNMKSEPDQVFLRHIRV